MAEECRACLDNDRAARGEDEFAVAELSSGIVRLNPTQYYQGAAFFVARRCVAELHELTDKERAAFLEEMTVVARAVHTAFSPRKLNYELHGNSVPHLHWWITPRYAHDPRPRSPIWENLDFLRAQWTGNARPTPEALADLRDRLLSALSATPGGQEDQARPLG